MKKYTIELSDELSCIDEDIAKMNKKKVEECLPIILERVIRTMLNPPEKHHKTNTMMYKDYEKDALVILVNEIELSYLAKSWQRQRTVVRAFTTEQTSRT